MIYTLYVLIVGLYLGMYLHMKDASHLSELEVNKIFSKRYETSCALRDIKTLYTEIEKLKLKTDHIKPPKKKKLTRKQVEQELQQFKQNIPHYHKTGGMT